jgi:hypothetical protein
MEEGGGVSKCQQYFSHSLCLKSKTSVSSESL